MASQQLNAPSRAQSGIPATVPPSGVAHQRHRHTGKFTVIGNHLAQHEGMSLVALGLGVYIQSLPDGVDVGIKSLAARFEEGEVTIAKGLRQLEAYGYLSRTRERTPQGRWVTRTVAYDMPSALIRQPPMPKPNPTPKPTTAPATATATGPVPAPATMSAPANTRSPARTPSPAPPLPEPDPPPLPAAPARPRVVPLQNCDRCDHAFRAPEPGTCPGCRAASRPAS
ncbi:helix-turn-helix domain-containing protein [Streptomyces sp. NPDC059892]|uniref:helix-turn-helix domain-containing protein n=1 Tax=Streptomyces sp. NPDC059892 TaxID=3346989 RepID=UPI0036537338